MAVDFVSLAVIVIVAAVCPIIAQAIPNKLVPESVFLLIAGAVLGPNLLGIIQVDEVITFLSDLGLGFLFLLAGMEINPRSIVGHEGKRGIVVWVVSLALAFLAVRFSPWFHASQMDGIAVAIAMTTTAFGTLVPIMTERGLSGTPVGDSIMAYGTWGELAPVLAIAILLSTRAQWQTLLILAVFAAFCVLLAVLPAKARKAGSRVFRFLTDKANSTYQTMMRFTMLVLVLLVAFSAIFGLDIVLGAFAAGFVMRYIIPEGNESLEMKLNGAAYGFFIPLFFVVSGAKVNILAIGENPLLLVLFIVALVVVRGVPIFVSLSTDKQCALSVHNRWSVALYCTTALPLIVAVTSTAVSAGAMSQDVASVLVAAGAITVFLMPLLASLTYRVADAMPGEALHEIRENPRDLRDIVRRHAMLERLVSLEMAMDRLDDRKREIANEGDSCDIEAYQAVSSRRDALKQALENTAQSIENGGEPLDSASTQQELAKIRQLRKKHLEQARGEAAQSATTEQRAEMMERLARIALAEAQRMREERSPRREHEGQRVPVESASEQGNGAKSA